MDKEMKQVKQKTWLIASLIFLSALVLILFALTAYLKDTAWLFLGFAGTALSIVLSVIAIVITLVDVAGQKQQVADITESAKKLRKILEQLKLENNELKNDLINHLNEESIGDLSDIQDYLMEISDKIQENNEELALSRLGDFSTELQNRIDKFKERDAYRQTTFDFDIEDFDIKTFKIRKNIKVKDLMSLENEIKSRGINIIKLWVEKEPNENYDLLIIKLRADVETKKNLEKLVIHRVGVGN